jgi:hypothetical protein
MPSTEPTKKRSAAHQAVAAGAYDNASQLVKRVDDLSSRFEKAAETSQAGDLLLHERISTVEDNLTKKIEAGATEVSKHIDKLGDRLEANLTALDKRVSILERWRWFIVGGAGVALFALSNYFLRIMLMAPK